MVKRTRKGLPWASQLRSRDAAPIVQTPWTRWSPASPWRSSTAPTLYNAVLDTIELIFRLPSQAHALSTAITTTEGIRLRLPVVGHPPYKVFWASDDPRIEAIFPHP